MENVEVLLVEDDPNDAELVLHVLKKNNMAKEIHIVHDGKEALDFLFSRGTYSGRDNTRLPKLVLLDLKLPHVHGHEVLKQVKENEKTQSIPVVILTSSGLDYDITKGYQLAVNSYVQKPTEFEKFEETVETIGRYWLTINKTSVT